MNLDLFLIEFLSSNQTQLKKKRMSQIKIFHILLQSLQQSIKEKILNIQPRKYSIILLIKLDLADFFIKYQYHIV